MWWCSRRDKVSHVLDLHLQRPSNGRAQCVSVLQCTAPVFPCIARRNGNIEFQQKRQAFRRRPSVWIVRLGQRVETLDWNRLHVLSVDEKIHAAIAPHEAVIVKFFEPPIVQPNVPADAVIVVRRQPAHAAAFMAVRREAKDQARKEIAASVCGVEGTGRNGWAQRMVQSARRGWGSRGSAHIP